MPMRVDKIRLTRAQDRRAKVTEEQCEEMRALWSEGMLQREIAEEYGISQSAVSYIVSEQARENLRKYRRKNPPRRRTRQQANEYLRDLRNYKKQILKDENKGESELYLK